MFIKSIRWRLQIWYGFILLAVLTAFGFTAYELEHGRLLRRIDDELHRRGSVLASSFARRAQNPMRPDQGPPEDRPGPDSLPEDRPPGPALREPPNDLRLPPQATALFDETDTNGYYYVFIWRDGRVFAQTANAPQQDHRALKGDQGTMSERSYPGGPVEIPLNHGNFREVEVRLPPGERIIVGRSIAPELGDFRRMRLGLAAIGALVLGLGLSGGWWLASRAIGPIRDISGAAAKISAGDLSQRINTADTESELGQLATVLNSTFARLEAAFAQQQQFTSDAAHELRTPVSVVLTQIQMALNRERSAPEYRETLQSCLRAAKRMRRLIESLLELARLDAGQEKMKRLPFDLAQTAGDCCELIRPLAKERGVELLLDLQTAKATGDADRLGLVITNLVTNAIQYNQTGGEVTVSTLGQNGSAMLKVSDTGQGIPAHDLPRIFERFYRAEKSRSSGNAGLGLAISKAIIEAQGGTIEAESEEGRGATFIVRLPINQL